MKTFTTSMLLNQGQNSDCSVCNQSDKHFSEDTALHLTNVWYPSSVIELNHVKSFVCKCLQVTHKYS